MPVHRQWQGEQRRARELRSGPATRTNPAICRQEEHRQREQNHGLERDSGPDQPSAPRPALLGNRKAGIKQAGDSDGDFRMAPDDDVVERVHLDRADQQRREVEAPRHTAMASTAKRTLAAISVSHGPRTNRAVGRDGAKVYATDIPRPRTTHPTGARAATTPGVVPVVVCLYMAECAPMSARWASWR